MTRLHPDFTESLKEKLTKVKGKLQVKLSTEEISNLCQTQIELTKLQIELENLQKQTVAQIQISSK